MQSKLQNKLLLATNNPGKLKELRALLSGLSGVALVSPADVGVELEVAETGGAYLENAALKAKAFAEASGLVALADDSGLEVDALDGAPGIYSARFGGMRGAAQHQVLLELLAHVPKGERTARFRAVAVACIPGGDSYHAEGVCEGQIGFAPKGEHGFGYDPLFILPEYGKTMAELDETVKNRISHRARAVQVLLPKLRQIFGLE
jgi:XTP/dITP diphosphohydrolase